jgi:glycosyltransferase involved in cell wall biosynthesis
MPKVVHVTTVHGPFDNRIFFKECASLRDNGWEVVLVAQHEQDETVDGIRIRALPKVASRLKRMRTLPPLAGGIAQSEEADVLHFHDPELLPLASRLARAGKLVIYDMHENIARDILTKRWINPLLRPLLSISVRQRMKGWLSRLSVIFAEDSYHTDYPYVRRHTTVLNMPRLAELSAIRAVKHTLPTLVYIGGVTELRGSLTMLRVLSLLQRAGHDVGLLIIGPVEQSHGEAMLQLISELELRNVSLHGFTRADQAWPLVAQCHVGLAILSRIPNYVESYPSKIFEYMALGLPVVTSDFELYRTIVEANAAGLCVAPEDDQAIAQGLANLLSDPDRMQAMGQAGRQAALAKYNWANEEHKLLQLYDELLG